MKMVFKNSSQLECIFTDEGITFYGPAQAVYFPYGCIDTIHMSLLGVLQATCRTQICSFAVNPKDRAKAKEMYRFAKEAMKTAPKAEPQIIDRTKSAAKEVSVDCSPEEQLRQYKSMFIQGAISKEEYDVARRRLQNS